jgi:hypothetical protein
MADSALNEQKADVADSSDSKQERELSTIDFPYTSLDDAVEVAKAVNKLGGNECRLDSLAAELGHDTVKSGGFRQRLASARIFGLTSLSKGIVSLNSLGAQIVDPDQEKTARVEAFLTVPLYKAIYEDFKSGTPLPPAQGLESKMVSLGVSNKQKDKARQVFQRSAKEAGFFAYGTTKLVYPAAGNSVAPPKPKDDHGKDDPDSGRKKEGYGGGGGGGRHPLIDGLIRALPKDGAWPKEARRKWLQAAAMNFDFVYDEDSSETKSIKVSLE